MSRYYTLDEGHNAVGTDDILVWGRWFDKIENRRVALDYVHSPDGCARIEVSTVCLGVDHSFGLGPPLLFETMVFSAGYVDERCERYRNWTEAVAGHARVLADVRYAVAAMSEDP